MCTTIFAFGIHSKLLFFLAFNRDEFLDRPTEPAHWWEDAPEILAGRDGLRKGTWLAISRSGRFAFLTNFREVHYNKVTSGPSRGVLPVQFVTGSDKPLEYLQRIDTQDQNGFNLVVGDLTEGQVAYLTNRDPSGTGPTLLPPGLYGLSNGILSSKWPKVEKARNMLQEYLRSEDLREGTFSLDFILDDVMFQCEKVDDVSELPQTGVPEQIEYELSSIMIMPNEALGSLYGTRTQTVVTGWANGDVHFHERSLYSARTSDAEKGAELAGQFGPSTVSQDFRVPISQVWETSMHST